MNSYVSSCEGDSQSDNEGNDVDDEDDEAPEKLPIPSFSRKKSKEHLMMKPKDMKKWSENGKRKGSRGFSQPK